MSIEVEGSNNRVAGRDYIENNLNLSSEDLKKLAALLAEQIKALPNDGKQHAFSVIVGGDQVGNLSLAGTQINIQAMEPPRKKTWDDLKTPELRESLKEWRRSYRGAFIRYWLNAPAGLILLLCATIIFSLLQGYLPINDPQRTWIAMILFIPTMGVLAWWLNRVRRIESIHMADCQRRVDAIEAALRRRRG